jgi:hypothetical protein
MYIVEPDRPEIRMTQNDGTVYVYRNYEEFIESTNYYFAERTIVDNFHIGFPENIFLRLWPMDIRPMPKCIVRDKYGNVYSREKILGDIKNYLPNYYGYNNRHKGEVFRYTPVSGTGKSHWGNALRYPKTTQELVLNEKYKGYTRGKRRNLPTSWDDQYRSDIYIKYSWKKQKKRKQWM